VLMLRAELFGMCVLENRVCVSCVLVASMCAPLPPFPPLRPSHARFPPLLRVRPLPVPAVLPDCAIDGHAALYVECTCNNIPVYAC
jgi:hypothetical protein